MHIVEYTSNNNPSNWGLTKTGTKMAAEKTLMRHSFIWCDSIAIRKISVFNVLWLTGGPRVAVWLGGRPRGSRLQREAGHPVPAPASSRRPAGGGGGHLTRSRVRQRKREQQQQWRARLAVSQSPPGKSEPAEAPEPTRWGGRGGGRD